MPLPHGESVAAGGRYLGGSGARAPNGNRLGKPAAGLSKVQSVDNGNVSAGAPSRHRLGFSTRPDCGLLGEEGAHEPAVPVGAGGGGLTLDKRPTDPHENAMEEVARLSPVFDLLRRRRPDLTADFARLYPELKDALEGLRPGSGEPGGLEGPRPGSGKPGGRRIRRPGSDEPGDTGTPSDLAKTTLAESKADLNEVLQVLIRRVKLLGRLCLGAGIVSSLSSAGMIAAVVGSSSPHMQIVTASIALLASLFGLVTIYVEDFSGGEGSTRRLRDLMTTQVRRLTEIDNYDWPWHKTIPRKSCRA